MHAGRQARRQLLVTHNAIGAVLDVENAQPQIEIGNDTPDFHREGLARLLFDPFVNLTDRRE